MAQHTIEHLDRWFRKTRKEFSRVVERFAGQPILYVEIGVWAGGAMEYVCQNVLTHPDSRAIGIDPYDQQTERKRWNMAEIKETARQRAFDVIGDRASWIYESSETALPKLGDVLQGRSIDLLYIDGRHEAQYALTDFLLAWPYLRNGSIVIFDDFVKDLGSMWPHVRQACAAIELCFGRRIRPLYVGRQYVLEVVQHRHPNVRERRTGDFPVYPDMALPRVLGQV